MTKLLLPHVPTLVMTSLIQTAEQQIAALAVVFTRLSNVDLTKQTGAGSGVNAAVCVFPWGPCYFFATIAFESEKHVQQAEDQRTHSLAWLCSLPASP